MTTKEQLIKEIDQAPDFLVEEVLNFLLFLKVRLKQKTSEATTPDTHTPLSNDSQTFLEAISQITAQVPQDDWKTLPGDLSKNLDHYLYGSPKTER
ncbi:MAG: hypothetical protein QNJ46_34405 [Leptolyngbyaceae cyanobacterium MO_188.B28]|nr:hypothetical protein [Leptolyngbyaceae cyanobacterium MO_188.B28]